MRLVEKDLGVTYLGDTEITWIKVSRVFDSKEEKKRYKWQKFQEMKKNKA